MTKLKIKWNVCIDLIGIKYCKKKKKEKKEKLLFKNRLCILYANNLN